MAGYSIESMFAGKDKNDNNQGNSQILVVPPGLLAEGSLRSAGGMVKGLLMLMVASETLYLSNHAWMVSVGRDRWSIFDGLVAVALGLAVLLACFALGWICPVVLAVVAAGHGAVRAWGPARLRERFFANHIFWRSRARLSAALIVVGWLVLRLGVPRPALDPVLADILLPF